MSSPDYESALDALADAQAENARLRELLRWRKTSEEPPPKSGSVLGYEPADVNGPGWVVVAEPQNYWQSPAPLETWWSYWRPLGPLPGDSC